MTVVGHAKVLEALSPLPMQTILIKGPYSVGKRTLAEHTARKQAIPADTTFIEKLTAEKAREVSATSLKEPLEPARIVIMRLDGASPEALNALLKLAEEPPNRFYMILLTIEATLPTIESRAATFTLGYLSDDEVAEVLMDVKGYDEDTARAVAPLGRGQVLPAIKAQDAEAQKAPVITALKAVADFDEQLLSRALNKWGTVEHALLKTWCSEVVTRRWRTFSPEESFGLQNDRDAVLLMLRLLNSPARPKIMAGAALHHTMASRQQGT